ncbi:MAG: DUF192 domain-containing protein [Acidimicrobiia bacterium]|nr:MAG: DUF192 domain-containing protein [Acidimicrobiia bacterium]
MVTRLLALFFVAATVGACTASSPSALPGFSSTTISIDDRELTVAVADTPQARRQGLMGITDLGELDGMLFVFDSEVRTGFWMKDTLIPLDIAFFDAEGLAVDRLLMVPCTVEECPTYKAAGPYRYAVEAPAGDLAFVGEGSALVLPDG